MAARRREAALLAALAAGALALSSGQARSATGPEVNVSNVPGPQNEPTIAIDPSNDRVLLAGSNSRPEGTMRVYTSTDGGHIWAAGTVYPRPTRLNRTCAADPGVAIDRTGRQYYSFVRWTPCRTALPRLYVASRPDSAAAWSRPVRVAPLGTSRLDDKPAIAVDVSPTSRFENRVYVAWTQVSRAGRLTIMLSSSDDGGRGWSSPVRVSRTGPQVSYASVAVALDGTVYVGWNDMTNFSVKITRSTDGGMHFEPGRKAASFAAVAEVPHCGSGIVIPAQRLTCVQPNPIVSVDRSPGPYSGRVYVTYMRTDFYTGQGVFVTVLDGSLQRLSTGIGSYEGPQVAPPTGSDRRSRFWPQSAADPASGSFWVCFYDTHPDPERKQAVYSCTVSLDGGGTFAEARPAASVASNETQPGADLREYGDYEGLAVANSVAHPIWTDSRNLDTLAEEIYTTRFTEADLVPPPGG